MTQSRPPRKIRQSGEPMGYQVLFGFLFFIEVNPVSCTSDKPPDISCQDIERVKLVATPALLM